MKTATDTFLDELLTTQNVQLKKLNKIVSDSIKEEELLVQNLSLGIDEPLNTSERLADKVATFGGSWRFIILFMLLLIVWIVINSVFLLDKAFDPYPFILMNLILSCIAALQAPIIMMSQNRQAAKDRLRQENDYQVNLKAELLVRQINSKLDQFMRHSMEQMEEIIQNESNATCSSYLDSNKLKAPLTQEESY